MNDRDRHFVEAVLRSNDIEARRLVHDEMSHFDAMQRHLTTQVVAGAGWWIELSDIAAARGKAFVAETAPAVAAISRSEAAFDALRAACFSLFDYLGKEAERRYRRNRQVYSSRDAKTIPLPPQWRMARESLELQVEIQRMFFDEPKPNLVATPALDSAPAVSSDRPVAKADLVNWLYQMVPDEQTSRPTKTMIWDKAQGKWPGRLSRRAFNAAWNDVRGSAPWIGLPGRPRKRAVK